MKVKEIESFEQYWKDNRFEYKKAKWNNDNPVEKNGDNIYFLNENSVYHQIPSKHSKKDGTENEKIKAHDLKGEFVLISDEFYYFGKRAIFIPDEFQYIIKTGPGHKSKFNEEQVVNILKWLKSLENKKKNQIEPFLIEKDVDICYKAIEYDGTLEEDEE